MPHITGRDFSHNRFYEHCFTTQLRTLRSFCASAAERRGPFVSGAYGDGLKRTNNGNSIQPAAKGYQHQTGPAKKGKGLKQQHNSEQRGLLVD